MRWVIVVALFPLLVRGEATPIEGDGPEISTLERKQIPDIERVERQWPAGESEREGEGEAERDVDGEDEGESGSGKEGRWLSDVELNRWRLHEFTKDGKRIDHRVSDILGSARDERRRRQRGKGKDDETLRRKLLSLRHKIPSLKFWSRRRKHPIHFECDAALYHAVPSISYVSSSSYELLFRHQLEWHSFQKSQCFFILTRPPKADQTVESPAAFEEEKGDVEEVRDSEIDTTTDAETSSWGSPLDTGNWRGDGLSEIEFLELKDGPYFLRYPAALILIEMAENDILRTPARATKTITKSTLKSDSQQQQQQREREEREPEQEQEQEQEETAQSLSVSPTKSGQESPHLLALRQIATAFSHSAASTPTEGVAEDKAAKKSRPYILYTDLDFYFINKNKGVTSVLDRLFKIEKRTAEGDFCAPSGVSGISSEVSAERLALLEHVWRKRPTFENECESKYEAETAPPEDYEIMVTNDLACELQIPWRKHRLNSGAILFKPGETAAALFDLVLTLARSNTFKQYSGHDQGYLSMATALLFEINMDRLHSLCQLLHDPNSVDFWRQPCRGNQALMSSRLNRNRAMSKAPVETAHLLSAVLDRWFSPSSRYSIRGHPPSFNRPYLSTAPHNSSPLSHTPSLTHSLTPSLTSTPTATPTSAPTPTPSVHLRNFLRHRPNGYTLTEGQGYSPIPANVGGRDTGLSDWSMGGGQAANPALAVVCVKWLQAAGGETVDYWEQPRSELIQSVFSWKCEEDFAAHFMDVSSRNKSEVFVRPSWRRQITLNPECLASSPILTNNDRSPLSWKKFRNGE